jgi:transmembrane sensor
MIKMSYKRFSMDFKFKPIKYLFTKRIRGTGQMGISPGQPEPGLTGWKGGPELQDKIWHEAGKVRMFAEINTERDWELLHIRLGLHSSLVNQAEPVYNMGVRIAATIVVLLVLSLSLFYLLTRHKNPVYEQMAIKAEQGTREFNLPDGSTVSLKQGSQLDYQTPFVRQTREVKLHGEALFEVMPDKQHPFKVFTGNSVVQVTGTRFNVSQEDGSVKVSVLAGIVTLSDTGYNPSQIRISANQSGYLLSDNQLKLENHIDVNMLSWKTGRLVFDDTPMDSALMDIAHHFGRDLVIRTKITDNITAEFEHQPLRAILQEINVVAGIKFDTSGTSLIVRK